MPPPHRPTTTHPAQPARRQFHPQTGRNGQLCRHVLRMVGEEGGVGRRSTRNAADLAPAAPRPPLAAHHARPKAAGAVVGATAKQEAKVARPAGAAREVTKAERLHAGERVRALGQGRRPPRGVLHGGGTRRGGREVVRRGLWGGGGSERGQTSPPMRAAVRPRPRPPPRPRRPPVARVVRASATPAAGLKARPWTGAPAEAAALRRLLDRTATLPHGPVDEETAKWVRQRGGIRAAEPAAAPRARVDPPPPPRPRSSCATATWTSTPPPPSWPGTRRGGPTSGRTS